MKFLLPLVVLLCACSAFAGSASKDKQIKCAVQGIEISMAQATKDHMFADYKGRRYFFCCNGCPQEFRANPAKYAKTAQSIPTPKAVKKSGKK